jgi:DNA-directed RNA polymerase specialized sigma24 family protein
MEDEFREFYDENFARVFAYLYARTGSVAAAKELTALAFERAREEWRGGAKSSLRRPSLFAIARAVHERYVESGRIDEHGPPAFSDDFGSIAEPDLLRLVSLLDPLEQEIVSLRFDAGLNYGEIAEVIGLSRGEIAQQMLAAIRKLTARMSQI